MKHKIIFLLIAVILMNGNLIGSNEPVLINIEEKELLEASMNIEISGAIKLYSVSKEDIELIDTEIITDKNNESKWYLAYNRDYYIGYKDAEIEAVTPSNFKRIAKKYFANISELAENIGQKGFRYKNLPTIILYFNKQTIEGKALVKEDKLTIEQIR